MKVYLKSMGFAVVLAVLPLASASAEMVTNGGFETGDLSGWTPQGSFAFSGVDAAHPHSGNYGAFFGAVSTTDSIMQTLTTVAGQSYSLSFWLANETGDQTNSFQASVDGNTVLTLDNALASSYTQYVFNFIASSVTTNLTFAARQDVTFWDLDDVSVTESTSTTPSPEPASLALLGAGLAGFGALRRKRK